MVCVSRAIECGKEIGVDILIVASDSSPRAESFVQQALEKGHRVYRGTPGKRLPCTEQPWLGVVCYAPGVSSSTLALLLEDVRYLSTGLFVVSSETGTLIHHDEEHWRTPETSNANLLQELAAHCRAEPAPPAVRDQLVMPLITAVRQTLLEMAGVEVVVRSVYQRTPPTTLGDMSAVLALPTARAGSLILSFSALTAESLGRRIFAEVKSTLTPELIQDCVGEVGNVVAGQAKALLAGTPYHFNFSPPMIATTNGERFNRDATSVAIAFDSDIGNLALQLYQRL
jgi:chemotaxis protein CheX